MLTGRHPRWYHATHELVKLGFVGTFNIVLDFGPANALHFGLHWPALAAKTVSASMAATSSYFMNRHWTLPDRARTGLGRKYSLVFVLNGVGLLIAAACILHSVRRGRVAPLRTLVVQRRVDCRQ
jgi:putative flippase GtrA